MNRAGNNSASRQTGATLIEVVLAIGILSIVSLAIWGGLTEGQQRTNASRNLAEMAQIQNYLYSQVEGGTNTVTNLPSTTYYFDDEGFNVSSSSPVWAYSARMNLVTVTNSVAIPSGSADTNLLSVSIQVNARSGASKTNYLYFVHP
jgi:uncharacterized protein (TIGR02598 family)